MKENHKYDDPRPKRTVLWAKLTEEFRAEARKYNDLCNELGRVFQPLQQEAYKSWCAWEAKMDAQSGEAK